MALSGVLRHRPVYACRQRGRLIVLTPEGQETLANMGPMDRWYQGPEILSIYGGTVEGRNETDFGFWYAETEYVYESAPRDYLEKEIQYLENEIIKMGRRYYANIMARYYAARDVHHRYYDGRERDPRRDATISRGPMYTGQGRKNTGQGLSHPSESAQS